MTDVSMFPDIVDPAPPDAPTLSRGEKARRRIDARIASGLHPLSYGGLVLRLHPKAATVRGGEGLTCGTCEYRIQERNHDKVYPKCWKGAGARITFCEASDVRAWWPACRDYEPNEGD